MLILADRCPDQASCLNTSILPWLFFLHLFTVTYATWHYFCIFIFPLGWMYFGITFQLLTFLGQVWIHDRYLVILSTESNSLWRQAPQCLVKWWVWGWAWQKGGEVRPSTSLVALWPLMCYMKHITKILFFGFWFILPQLYAEMRFKDFWSG